LGERGGLHTWHRANLGQQAGVEIRSRRRRGIPRGRQRDMHGDAMFGLKARARRRQAPVAADEKTGAHEQHAGERYLRDRQGATGQ
jgi:hypothetical protein